MTNSNDALRACPFCGDSAAMEVDEDEFEIARGICGNCGACGPFVDLSEYSSIAEAKDAAGAAWNRRPSPVAGGDLREVTQADRDAALDLVSPDEARRIASGNCDHHQLVQLLASHRSNAIAALNQPAAPVEAVRVPCPDRFDPAHDEAIDWIIGNCMGIRRDKFRSDGQGI